MSSVFLLPGTGMTEPIILQLDHYVTITPGEPFRLFPFGVIHKNGKQLEITPDVARAIKLPHFKPPIKLGSHKDETPAGGYIKALEVRADGLYAIPEWNEAGLRALNDGAYRYHSPEIIWGGELEDSVTGQTTEGNIVVGAALTHIPALGEAAAFFETTVNELEGDEAMSENTVSMPASLWERTLDAFKLGGGQQEPAQPQSGQDNEPDEFAAKISQYEADLEAERARVAEFEARIEKMEAESKQAERVAHFAAQLEGTNLKGDEEFAVTLAALDDEHAEIVVQKVKALSAQADKSLEKDIGASDGDTGGTLQTFEALVQEKMKAGMTRSEAYQAVIAEKPDLYGEAVTNG